MKLFLTLFLLAFSFSVVKAQESLPVIKSNSNKISIKDGDELRKDTWNLVPEAKPDVYETSVKKGVRKNIAFITDIDRIDFEVEAGKTYDFIIRKGDANCYTQIKVKELKFWNDPAFWESPALKTPYKENITDSEKIAGLSKFWSEAKYNFINFDLVPDIDWDKTYLEYIPKVLATKSTLEYYKVLMEVCAKLGDAHTNIFLPDELANEFYARPALRTRLIENKVLIVAIYDEALKQQGLSVGQEIVAIDGVPVKTYAEKSVRPYQSASTAHDLITRMYEYALLSGAMDAPLNLKLRDLQGKTFDRTVKRLSSEERGKKIPFSSYEYKMLPRNVAYVALNSFGNDEPVKKFAADYAEISKADALIIDLRNNGGGSSGVGYAIISYLVDQPFKGSKWYTREYHPTFRAWGRAEKTFGDENAREISLEEIRRLRGSETQPFLKPVVVLASPRTFSAAEDFLVAFKPLKRGVIIGEPSGGSTGQPLSFSLPGGGGGRICSKRDSFADGTEFVGVGVLPDITIAPKVTDYTEGKDAALERALEELKKR
jgi:carboxyl-terminal processing protease